MRFAKNKKNMAVGRPGFSLTEVMVATFIFSMIAVSVTGAFGSSISGYRHTKAIQRNLEEGEFAMNLMAKTIRMSSVLDHGAAFAKIFDYSRGKCLKYEFSGNELTVNDAAGANTKDLCDGASFVAAEAEVLTGQYVDSVNFSVTPSSSTAVGKATISMEICSNSGCSGNGNDTVRLQTTVSLRDYSVSGI